MSTVVGQERGRARRHTSSTSPSSSSSSQAAPSASSVLPATYSTATSSATNTTKSPSASSPRPTSATNKLATLPMLEVPEFVSTPTATTALAAKMDFQSPMPHARLATAMLMPVGRTASALPLPMTCTFEALSHHFHLPLKVAAEKFGVRATAFKKRCRAIGIRHWPYRKVRSLRRSLEELGRCREEGMLNDKQQHQLLVFQSQLDKLLSPETYGIDPSGRLPPGAFDDRDDDDQDDDDTGSCSSGRSPLINAVGDLSHFKIATLRTKHKKQPAAMKRDFSLSSGTVTMSQPHATHHFQSIDGGLTTAHSDFPSVSVRFATHGLHSNMALPGFESYDPFFQDFKSEFTFSMEDFGGDEPINGSLGIDGVGADEFMPFVRSPTMAALRMAETRTAALTSPADSATPSSATSSSGSHDQSPSSGSGSGSVTGSSVAMDDDVFQHISPDYGCLV